MPPLNSKSSQRASTQRMVDVSEKVLRGVYESTFRSCSWATASEEPLSSELQIWLEHEANNRYWRQVKFTRHSKQRALMSKGPLTSLMQTDQDSQQVMLQLKYLVDSGLSLIQKRKGRKTTRWKFMTTPNRGW